MPVNLSLKSRLGETLESVGTFYWRIHDSIRDNVDKAGLPPTVREFAAWFDRQHPGDQRNLSVLDVGCGLNAFYSRHVLARGCRKVYAVDINPVAIESVGSRFPAIAAAECSALDLPFPDCSFALVTCGGVAHHTPDPKRVLVEIYRVLQPGGSAYVTLYSFRGTFAEWLVRAIRVAVKILPYEIAHSLFRRSPVLNNFVLDHAYVPILWLYNRDDVVALLSEIGFEIVADWPSVIDAFSHRRYGKMMTGDGLIRIYVCKKR